MLILSLFNKWKGSLTILVFIYWRLYFRILLLPLYLFFCITKIGKISFPHQIILVNN
uniref:Uncharacterized protein n=1 Tax=Myoviridae sp. ctNQV2 TaxID=2827683 RepID=A0A8S5RZC4_9CAUD|nr:MAG TPA: hypothetical protein [Myoviridae sp. ctNQV2]